MAGLEIRLLGRLEISVAGRPVTDFESATTRALLARLAHDPGVRLPRPALAEMLWPDRKSGKALANLRHSFAVLRRLLADRERDHPLLVGTRDAVVLEPGPDVWVDLLEFRRLASRPRTVPGAAQAWRAAEALRRGPLLAGFDPGLSGEWEAWLVTSRAEADRLAVDLLTRLAGASERAGRYDEAIARNQHILAIDRYHEAAERGVVTLLARSGRPIEAIAHGEAFLHTVGNDLGVRASPELAALLGDIREGRLAPTPVEVDLPVRMSAAPPEPCVARQDQLAQLDTLLDDAAAGSGRVVFISGSAGSGKSVLLRSFAASVADRMPGIAVLQGTCNAHTGPGDPYLPFRQMLGLLCGELDRAWIHRELTPAQAEALWASVPATVEVLLDAGPHLLGTMVDGNALLRRLDSGFPGHPVTSRLAEAVRAAALRASIPAAQQPMLDEYVGALSRLATDRPLLMLIDDLHYADQGTIGLFRHLAGAVRDVPILVVAALRPPVPAGGPGGDHVARMLDEVCAASPDGRCLVELVGSRQFVDAWLDTQRNRLDEAFRDQLFRTTQGHALFTVELVAALRDRGDVVQDEDGWWVASGTVDWDLVPPRVEALIGARLADLSSTQRRDLEVASVQGETFLAEVVASVRRVSEQVLADRLSRLSRSAQPLLEQVQAQRLGSRPVARYRFRHRMFQVVLRDGMAEPDRRMLHRRTAEVLSAMYADRIDDVVVELARHHDEAGDIEAAIRYHGRAGSRAASIAGTGEAVVHLRRALELLDQVDRSGARDHQEADLLLHLGACLQALAGYNAPDTTEVYDRLRLLLTGLGPSPETAAILGALISVDGLRGRYADARACAERMLAMADELGAAPITSAAHMQMGWLMLMTAHLAEAEEHCDRAIAGYDASWDPWLTPALGVHIRSAARAWRAILRWIRGHPDAARRDAHDAIAEARRVGHPFSLVLILSVAGCVLDEHLGDGHRVVAFAGETASIAEREDFTFYRAAAQLHRGLGLAMTGVSDPGFTDIEAGLAAWAALGTSAFRPWIMSAFAEHLVAAGELDWAERVMSDIDHQLMCGEERLADCFAPTARAAVLRARGDDGAAESVLRAGITLVDERGARGPLLRTATALAELLCDHGRHDEAVAAVAPVLAGLEEGTGTPDALGAAAVLSRARSGGCAGPGTLGSS